MYWDVSQAVGKGPVQGRATCKCTSAPQNARASRPPTTSTETGQHTTTRPGIYTERVEDDWAHAHDIGLYMLQEHA